MPVEAGNNPERRMKLSAKQTLQDLEKNMQELAGVTPETILAFKSL